MSNLEEITGKYLYELFNSRRFVNKLVTTIKKTFETGNECKFDVYKKLGNDRFELSRMTQGDPSSSRDPPFNVIDTLNDKKFYIISLHTHPGNGYARWLPSPEDFQNLNFLKNLNSLAEIKTRPLGVVVSSNGKDSILDLTLYQEGDHFPADELNQLLKMRKIADFGIEHITPEFKKIYKQVASTLNKGLLQFDLNKKEYIAKGYVDWWGWSSREQVDFLGVMENFSYTITPGEQYKQFVGYIIANGTVVE